MFVCDKSTFSSLEKLAVQAGVLVLESVLSIVGVYFIAVLFGASLLDEFSNNFIFSTLLTAICLMPTFILVPHRRPLELIIRLLVNREFSSRIEEACTDVAYGGAIGSWFGCFVLPLDWDRWWQQWPVPCCFGALLGASVALIRFNCFSHFAAKKRQS